MKPIYTLHKLKEGFIVTSNKAEEGINPKATYYDDKVDSNGLVTLPEMFTEKLNTYLVKGIKENRRYVYKVIAQQNQIDLSCLSEEEQKEIGWFDVEKLSLQDNEFWRYGGDYDVFETGFKAGFQKAQELLSDRRFTLEDIKKAIRYGFDVGFCSNSSNKVKNDLQSEESFISQPKSWKVEGILENDKFKITKIL
jgi:phage antirepressor YoqD-like protein